VKPNPDTQRPPSGRVLVLGHDDRSLLACVRALGRRGLEVHLAWCPRDSITRRSRYVAVVHDDLPPPEAIDGDWFAPLRSLLESKRFDLVFPTQDPAVVALMTRVRELQSLTRVVLPSARAYRITYDKLATWELARELGLPVPPQGPSAGGELGWPVVLKPRHAWRFGCKKWERRVTLARDPEELETAATVLGAHNQVLAQGFVPGRGVGVDVLARAGRILLAFQHERQHEPPEGGGSSYRRSVPLDPVLLAEATKLIAALELTGLAMVEFRCDAASGAHWLLEVNARPWGSLPLAVAAGVDFPGAAYDLFVEDRAPVDKGYHPRRFGRHLARDPWFLLENRHQPHGDPTRVRVPAAKLLTEPLNLLLGRERWDELTLDDPRPGLIQLARTARELAGLTRRRLRAATDRLGARSRARRAHSRLIGARRILLVCKGNICRSPFAAATLARLLPRTEIESSGTFPEPRRPCPVQARMAAAHHGVDLDPHRSRVLDSTAMQAADLVLVFDRAGRHLLHARYPEQAHKLMLAGDLDERGAREVADPYGGGLPAFRACYQRIEQLWGAVSVTEPKTNLEWVP
jgi:protein-tyrosine-phosphatase/predicted ATP-grasp superfamily ATP-dependent carboligase